MDIYLAVPDATHEYAVLSCEDEFVKLDKPGHIHGSGGLQSSPNYHDWLAKISKDDKFEQVPGRVRASQYIAIRKDDEKVIGFIQLRHTLNDNLLLVGGHIGYSVRPTERRKGYASNMLMLCLENAKELGIKRVLMTCGYSNTASERVIIKAGGELENTVTLSDGKVKKRFWINLK